MMWKPIRYAAPLAAMFVSACFATQSDIRVLQSDLNLMRSESAAADSTRRVQLDRVTDRMDRAIDRVLVSLRAANDSVSALSTRMTKFRSDMSTSVASIDQQLIAIQELTGQSQRRLQEVRTSLEERNQTQEVPTAAVPGATSGAAPGATTPGPNQLFQIAREQMMQGSNQSARQAFQDLLTQYPKSDLASAAQFYVAETYAAEGNAAAADSVYNQVATKYAGAPQAATALYKRGVAAQNGDNAALARKLFQQLIAKYPRSDEAALAKDRMKQLSQ